MYISKISLGDKPLNLLTTSLFAKYVNSNSSMVLGGTNLAAGLGLEPRYTDSESAVLPLDDPAMGDGLHKIR